MKKVVKQTRQNQRMEEKMKKAGNKKKEKLSKYEDEDDSFEEDVYKEED